MTLFKMLFRKPLLWVLFAVAYGPGAAWACENILKASRFQISQAQLTLPHREGLVREIADHALIFPIHEGKQGFWTVVFDPRPNEKNEGYIIEGRVRQGHYIGLDVRHTRAEDEKDYFKTIARMHGLKDQTLVLNRLHARCETIHVNAWIEAKLWLKHGLRAHEVKTLLESPETVRIYDDPHRDRRYRIQAHDKRGRAMAIVIAEKEDCPHVLITAYEESADKLH